MVQPTLFRRLAFTAVMVVVCACGWLRTEAAAAAIQGWDQATNHASTAHTALRTVVTDFDGDGDADRVAIQSDLVVHVWLNDGLGRFAPLAIADVALWEARDLSVSIDQTSTADNSDQSDAAAHVEPRAGPFVFQLSRAVQVRPSAAPRSRPHSSSTPRAPPASLRFS